LILSSSCSQEKSFSPISRVVIMAIVTEREMTGEMISLIALSSACATILVRSMSSVRYCCRLFMSM